MTQILKTLYPNFQYIGQFTGLQQTSSWPLLFVVYHPIYGEIFYGVSTPDNYRVTVFYYCPQLNKQYTYTSGLLLPNPAAGFAINSTYIVGKYRYFLETYGTRAFYVDPYAILNLGVGVYPLPNTPEVCGVLLNNTLASDDKIVIKYGVVSDSLNGGKVYASAASISSNQVLAQGFIGRYLGSQLPFNIIGGSISSNYGLSTLQYTNGYYRGYSYAYGYEIGKPQCFYGSANCATNSNEFNEYWGYSVLATNLSVGPRSDNLDTCGYFIPVNNGSVIISPDGIYGYNVANINSNRNNSNVAYSNNYVGYLQINNNNVVSLYVAQYQGNIQNPIQNNKVVLTNFHRPVSILGKYKA